MNQREKLRATLREYYDNQEVPFNDNEWVQASALLKSVRRTRKTRKVAPILVVVFATVITVLINFPELTNRNKKQIASFSHSSPKLENSRLSALPNTQKVFKSKKQTIVSSATPSITSGVAPDSIIHPKKSSLAPDSDTKPSDTNHSQIFESVITAVATSPVEHQNKTTVKNQKNNNPIAAQIKVPENSANQSDKENQGIKESLQNNEGHALLQTKVEEITTRKNLSDKNEHSEPPENALPQAITPFDVNENNSKNPTNENEELIVPKDKIENEPKNFTDSSAIVDTVATANGELVAPSSPEVNLVQEGIFYEVGAAGYYGWKGTLKRDARGFSPVIGINYINTLSNHYSLSFGVQYLQVPKLSNSSKTSRVSSYKYGEQSKVTSVTPSTIHYLVVPLRINYYTNNRNSFGAGINLAYLLNVDATVTTYDESPGLNANYETVKLGGYTQGFSWFDSQLAFCYRRKIGRSLGVQTEVFMGLTDVKQDKFFGFKNKERNSGLKLSLIYFAFRKKDK